MADENEPLDLDASEIEIEADEAPEDQEAAEAAAEEEDFTIELEGEEAAEEEAPLVKTLRQEIRDRDKRLAAFERTSQPKIEVGEKPTLESCDYDEEKFETELDAWKERGRAAAAQEEEAGKAVDARNQEFAKKAMTYRAKLEALPLPAEQKAAAEKVVIDSLPELLQSAIVSYTDDPAKVVVALAKHPARLEKLAAETDPIRFIIAVRELERNMKVVQRKKPSAPDADNVLSGSAQLSPGKDPVLEKLEREADRTKDRTKVQAYMRTKRAA